MAWFDAKSLEKSVGGRLHQVWNLEIDERQYKISNGEYKCNMRGDQATENWHTFEKSPRPLIAPSFSKETSTAFADEVRASAANAWWKRTMTKRVFLLDAPLLRKRKLLLLFYEWKYILSVYHISVQTLLSLACCVKFNCRRWHGRDDRPSFLYDLRHWVKIRPLQMARTRRSHP